MRKNVRNIDAHASRDCYRVIAAGISALILTVGLARFAYTPMLFAGKANYIWIVVGLAAIPSCYFQDRTADRIGHIDALIPAFLRHYGASATRSKTSLMLSLRRPGGREYGGRRERLT